MLCIAKHYELGAGFCVFWKRFLQWDAFSAVRCDFCSDMWFKVLTLATVVVSDNIFRQKLTTKSWWRKLTKNDVSEISATKTIWNVVQWGSKQFTCADLEQKCGIPICALIQTLHIACSFEITIFFMPNIVILC